MRLERANANSIRPDATRPSALRKACLDDQGLDIENTRLILAFVLIIVVGMVRLVGSQTNNVFSRAGLLLPSLGLRNVWLSVRGRPTCA